MMSILIDIEPEPEEPAEYDWAVKEDVFFQIRNRKCTWAMVIDSPDGPSGMATYAADEGSCLEWMVEGDFNQDLGDGDYVHEQLTGHYLEGDGWEIDDDMMLDWEEDRVRPATSEEIQNWGEQ